MPEELSMKTIKDVIRTLHVPVDLDVKQSTGPEVIKLFSCSTQLSMKFELLTKTKIRTNIEDSCFKSLRCCIYPANQC